MSSSHGSSAGHPAPQPPPGPSQALASAANLQSTSAAEHDDLLHPSSSASSDDKTGHGASPPSGSDPEAATASTPREGKGVTSSPARSEEKSSIASSVCDLGQRTRDSSSSDAHTHPSSSSPSLSSSSPPVTSSSFERAYAQQRPKDESSGMTVISPSVAEDNARVSEPVRKVIGERPSCAQGGKSPLLSSLSSSSAATTPSSPLAIPIKADTERLLKSGVELGARSKSQPNSRKSAMVSSDAHKVKDHTTPGAKGAHPEQSELRAFAARDRKKTKSEIIGVSPVRGMRSDEEKTKDAVEMERLSSPQRDRDVHQAMKLSVIKADVSPADNQSQSKKASRGSDVTEATDPIHVRLDVAEISSPRKHLSDDIARTQTPLQGPKVDSSTSQMKDRDFACLEDGGKSPEASRIPSSGKGVVTSLEASKLSSKPVVPSEVQSKNSTPVRIAVEKHTSPKILVSTEQDDIQKKGQNGTSRAPLKSQSIAAKDAALPTYPSHAPTGSSGGDHPHEKDGDKVTSSVVIPKNTCNGHTATPTKQQIQSPRIRQITASETKSSGKSSRLDSSSTSPSSSSSSQSLSIDKAATRQQRSDEEKLQQQAKKTDSPQLVPGVKSMTPIQLSPASKTQSPNTKHVSIREPETTTGKNKELVVQSSQKSPSMKTDLSPTPSTKDSESAGPSRQQSSLGDAESESTGTWVEDGRGGTVSKGEINGMANPRNSKSCCFCWCCCCSCSCLSVNNNIRRQKDKKQKEKQSGSSDHFINGEGEAPATLEDIRTWGESFDKLMKCGAGRKVFREFLKCEYSEENILFWQACEDLKKETNPEATEEKARVIYEDFISILSPREVSLDSAVRDVINKNMVRPTTKTFDEAQLQIYTLMHRDSYPRFVNSPQYRQLAQLPVPSRKGSMV